MAGFDDATAAGRGAVFFFSAGATPGPQVGTRIDARPVSPTTTEARRYLEQYPRIPGSLAGSGESGSGLVAPAG